MAMSSSIKDVSMGGCSSDHPRSAQSSSAQSRLKYRRHVTKCCEMLPKTEVVRGGQGTKNQRDMFRSQSLLVSVVDEEGLQVKDNPPAVTMKEVRDILSNSVDGDTFVIHARSCKIFPFTVLFRTEDYDSAMSEVVARDFKENALARDGEADQKAVYLKFNLWSETNPYVEGHYLQDAFQFGCEIYIEGLPEYAWDVRYAQVALEDSCVVISYHKDAEREDSDRKIFKLTAIVRNPADIPGSCDLILIEPTSMKGRCGHEYDKNRYAYMGSEVRGGRLHELYIHVVRIEDLYLSNPAIDPKLRSRLMSEHGRMYKYKIEHQLGEPGIILPGIFSGGSTDGVLHAKLLQMMHAFMPEVKKVKGKFFNDPEVHEMAAAYEQMMAYIEGHKL